MEAADLLVEHLSQYDLSQSSDKYAGFSCTIRPVQLPQLFLAVGDHRPDLKPFLKLAKDWDVPKLMANVQGHSLGRILPNDHELDYSYSSEGPAAVLSTNLPPYKTYPYTKAAYLSFKVCSPLMEYLDKVPVMGFVRQGDDQEARFTSELLELPGARENPWMELYASKLEEALSGIIKDLQAADAKPFCHVSVRHIPDQCGVAGYMVLTTVTYNPTVEGQPELYLQVTEKHG